MSSKISSHAMYTRLQRQVKKNDVLLVEQTLASIEEPDIRRQLVHRALRWAFRAKGLETFNLLLEPRWGFDPNREVSNSQTQALLLEMMNDAAKDIEGLKTFVLFLPALVQAGVPLEHPAYTPHQPLSLAVSSRFPSSMIKALLKAGADPDGMYRWSTEGTSSHVFPPLCSASSLHVVGLLLEYGASLGAPPFSMPHGIVGGVGYLLYTWPKDEELGQLWDMFEQAGGHFLTPMENGFGEMVPLAVNVLIQSLENPAWKKYPDSPALEKMKASDQKMMRRQHRLQELMVARGLDLYAPSPYRFPWAEFIKEKGSPLLQKKLEFEDTLPLPAPSSKAPRF